MQQQGRLQQLLLLDHQLLQAYKVHLFEPSPQQRPDLYEQPGLILAPFRAVALELLYDGHERLVLLHCEVGDSLRRGDGLENVLVQDLINALAHNGLVPPPVCRLAHHLRLPAC